MATDVVTAMKVPTVIRRVHKIPFWWVIIRPKVNAMLSLMSTIDEQ